MKNVPYGISDLIVSEKVSRTVKFGDGLTKIYSVSWGDNFGLELVRDESIKPFHKNKVGDDDWVDPKTINEESVFIVFDNEKSLDVMISQLQYLKKNINSIDN